MMAIHYIKETILFTLAKSGTLAKRWLRQRVKSTGAKMHDQRVNSG